MNFEFNIELFDDVDKSGDPYPPRLQCFLRVWEKAFGGMPAFKLTPENIAALEVLELEHAYGDKPRAK